MGGLCVVYVCVVCVVFVYVCIICVYVVCVYVCTCVCRCTHLVKACVYHVSPYDRLLLELELTASASLDGLLAPSILLCSLRARVTDEGHHSKQASYVGTSNPNSRLHSQHFIY